MADLEAIRRRADEATAQATAETDTRSCTCHPSEAFVPCQRQYAYTHCKVSWLETQLASKDAEIAQLKAENGSTKTHNPDEREQ